MTSRAMSLRRTWMICTRRQFSTEMRPFAVFPNDEPKPWPKTTQMPVHFRNTDKRAVQTVWPKGARILTLKKIKGLTTMTQKDLRAVNEYVRMWDENFAVQMSVLQGPKHGDFCSGVNLQDLRGPRSRQMATRVRLTLEALARLVTSMRLCRAPLLSVISGASYGMAGYALASGRYRVCTEKSMFCIPEATLGLGLASGLSYVLPRLLDGHKPLGLCLALTGMALRGADLFSAQLASQYFTCNTVAALAERVGDAYSFPNNPFEKEDRNVTGAGQKAVLQIIEDHCLLSWSLDGVDGNEYLVKGPDGEPVPHSTPLHGILPEIERVFTADTVEEIFKNLGGCEQPWAELALKNMRQSSPLSLKVMFNQLTRGATMGVQECLDEEFQVNMNLFGMNDFDAAMLAQKSEEGEPKWTHPTLEDVTDRDVAKVFRHRHKPRVR